MNKQVEIKQKLYQMFIMGLDGESLQNNPNLINALKNGLGGVIFFTQNIKTADGFKNLTQEIKNISLIPPFLSIDQEGGRVERTENIHGGKKYLSAKFAVEQGEDFIKRQTEQISRELKDFGINLNFAPCIDVNTNPNNPIIGERAFSNDPDEVIKFGKLVVNTYIENGIIPCVKHFPGHGDASVDSHISLPKIDLTMEEMEKSHIKPFWQVLAPMVMVAHLHCTCFDKEEIPTSLSKNAIDYLRNEIGYDGLIITDDMIMGGVLRTEEKGKRKKEKVCHCEEGQSTDAAIQNGMSLAKTAIKAGVNILLYRNSYDDTIQIIENLAELAKTDIELRQNIEKSYEEILKIKK